MTLSFAVRTFEFCDVATVRDGLMTVVNGGLNHLPRSEYPAELNAYLALGIEISGMGEKRQIDIQVVATCETDSSHEIQPYNWTAEVDPSEQALDTFDSIVLNLAVDAQALRVPAAGVYRFDLTANGSAVSTIRVQATQL